MTLVHYPLSLAGRLHFTRQDRKRTYCGVWIHPTYWTADAARPTIATRCLDCVAETRPPESQSVE